MAPTLPPSSTEACSSSASATLSKLWKLDISHKSAPLPPLPRTSIERLTSADPEGEKTILYLAYGSNLSAETFKGTRGIQPLSAVNVHVPSLDLTFDLAGIPYIEPCFANTRYRREPTGTELGEQDYHKDRWTKGLIGVVYEVTPEDYRTIIATEGGGASYLDVVVPCFPLPDGTKVVSEVPEGEHFHAHTLLQPADEDALPTTTTDVRRRNNGRSRIHRPDPSYAQPSARYLKLITDGAEEHSLPDNYVAYLYNIRPYTITTVKQRIGQGLMVTMFGPMLLLLFGLGKVFADEEGKIPAWLATLMGMLFRMLWGVYDGVFVKAFGDGERTIGDSDSGDEECGLGKGRRWCEKGVRLQGAERTLR